MTAFPAISPHYLEWEQSFPQVMDWFDRAIEMRKGESEELELSDEEVKDNDFIYNKIAERWE